MPHGFRNLGRSSTARHLARDVTVIPLIDNRPTRCRCVIYIKVWLMGIEEGIPQI